MNFFNKAIACSLAIGSVASANNLHHYAIHATSINETGDIIAMANKLVEITVSYQGRHMSIDRVMSARTDRDGQALITFDENQYDEDAVAYSGVTEFCGNFDGKNQCAPLSLGVSAAEHGESVILIPEKSRKPRVHCEVDNHAGFATLDSSLEVTCDFP
jgi:hypothetical protein